MVGAKGGPSGPSLVEGFGGLEGGYDAGCLVRYRWKEGDARVGSRLGSCRGELEVEVRKSDATDSGRRCITRRGSTFDVTYQLKSFVRYFGVKHERYPYPAGL